MSLYSVVPPTSRLEDLIAAVVLGPLVPIPVKEKSTILQQYEHSDGLTDLKQEILAMVCFKALLVTLLILLRAS
jgi:hypothetical protein